MERETLVYLDGKFVPKSEAKISVFDHGLLYGDGVFEGIRAFDGSVFMLKEHVDRLYDSASCLELTIPMDRDGDGQGGGGDAPKERRFRARTSGSWSPGAWAT